MADRKVVMMGDELLRKKSKPVRVFDEYLWDLLDDMKETMHHKNGAGLAAVHVVFNGHLSVVVRAKPVTTSPIRVKVEAAGVQPVEVDVSAVKR